MTVMSFRAGRAAVAGPRRCDGQLAEQALVRTILEHAEDYPWVMQEIGLLGLRLDDKREYRLHVWDPSSSVGEPPIHDHPFDFTSTVIAGEMTNTRYDGRSSRCRVPPRALHAPERG